MDSNTEKFINISKTNEYLEIYKALRALIMILPSEKPRNRGADMRGEEE